MEQFIDIDIYILQSLKNLRSPGLADFFYYVTQLGDSIFIISATLLISTILYFLGRKREVIVTLGVVGFTYVTVYWLKSFFDRERPLSDLAYYLEDSLSFPSGHAAIAIAFYGLLIYLMKVSNFSPRTRFLVYLLLSTLIVTISFSRIFLGVHYLSDIIGGFVVGLVWLWAGIWLLENWNRRFPKQ